MHPYPLIHLLADGQLHSGTELAERLGVSRTAVWKQLRRLEELGLEVESVQSQGYRLAEPLDLLSRASIEEALARWEPQPELTLEPVVASTNSTLMASGGGATAPRVCLAEQQLQGRGRRGRSWVSPFARNLYLSIGLETEAGPAAVQGLTLRAGIGAARALSGMGISGLGIKWPNDLWLNGRKVAGILTELQGSAQDELRLVIGIGLNVYMTAPETTIDQPWTSLAQEGAIPPGGRNGLAIGLIQGILGAVSNLGAGAASDLAQEWAEYDVLRGRQVAVRGSDCRGIGYGIDGAGQLRLRTTDGEEVLLNAGEVSLEVPVDPAG
ncbi:biotin--[acetyl-CoA-carboxylase] ligase [Halomonadaceae bacterium KBTZ08]